METTRSHNQWALRRRPGAYQQTPQQQRFREAAEACGIRQGITRKELVEAMTQCIPRYYAEQVKKKGQQ